MAAGTPAFIGRARECAVLDRALQAVRRGESAVVVIRGEAGIGKTAMLQYCADRAGDWRVAQIAGIQSELELPFAALHQLCAPMLGGLAVLPEPQQRALRVAFGLTTGSAPDRFVLGLAVLGLLAEAASKEPLLCLVDDAQWLDEASAQVLGFVGRRLLAESILLLFAARDTGANRLFGDLPELRLGGLTDEDARELLAAAIPGHLDEQIRDRIVAETRGNPLGLLELPRGMTPAELAGGFGFPAISRIPVPGHIEELYQRRIAALPDQTQRMLLVAAADPTGDATLVWRAAQSLGVRRDAAAAGEADQLLEIGSRVRFGHPLMRSAVYAAASPEARSAAHRALAAATDGQSDPEHRVWHLAAAATGYDEEVASELERTAAAVQARAGLAAAAAFLQRSAALTADPVRRADRALAAAQAHLNAGSFGPARALLPEAAAGADDDLRRARVEQLNGQIEAASKPGREAPVRLLQAAKRLEELDAELARETYLQAWWAAVFAGGLAAPGGHLLDVSEAARSAPRAADPRPCDVLLEGLATTVTEGRTAAAASLRRAVDLYLTEQVAGDDWIRWGRSATSAALILWDFDSYSELSARQLERARASGALSSLVPALNFHANIASWSGDLELATSLVAEQEAVKEVTGIRMASYGAQLLAAYKGRPNDLSLNNSAIDRELAHGEDGHASEASSLGTAVLNNALGRYTDAAVAAREVAYGTSFLAPFALSELVEAEVRTGGAEVAVDALRRLSEQSVAGSDWAAGINARCRALLSTGDEAQHSYAEAIACLGRTPLRPDLARAHLLYGEWLRRDNRRVDARDQLRTAHEMFVAIGADAFADRARRELVATGERVRKRDPSTRNALTPQEEHIARLARDGRTNSEIGAELFLSTRTVEWHLGKVFTKLGIASRRELKDALLTPGSPVSRQS